MGGRGASGERSAPKSVSKRGPDGDVGNGRAERRQCEYHSASELTSERTRSSGWRGCCMVQRYEMCHRRR